MAVTLFSRDLKRVGGRVVIIVQSIVVWELVITLKDVIYGNAFCLASSFRSQNLVVFLLVGCVTDRLVIKL